MVAWETVAMAIHVIAHLDQCNPVLPAVALLPATSCSVNIQQRGWQATLSRSVLYPFATEEGPFGAETFCLQKTLPHV